MSDRKQQQSKADKPLTYRQKAGITFTEQADPPFIAKIKQKTGYREPAKVEDKFVDTPLDDEVIDKDDIRNLTEEERPVIVVMDPKTDVSSAQLDKEIEKMREEEDRKKIDEGRIIFRKPTKRTTPTDNAAPSDAKEGGKRSRPDSSSSSTDSKSSSKNKPNSRLLSFGDEEEKE